MSSAAVVITSQDGGEGIKNSTGNAATTSDKNNRVGATAVRAS